ncbi:MAG: 50S ribosomal protein L44e [Candidatus Diapherotrites archaeon]|uniref:50S ribosomal protein L44e n=1 Tax=Candidatus Iainarchaeum sp. TaxID=3101447 RepID=A0A7J4J0J7_9ARCH|nr:MAG: 50S ribosomal protein L44e, large subunit ribosomal protein L44e [archaeon GW2011_AR10]MBS3058969.1 50S ribosomal protein L44e [Candidatus Diapherotrites archaeon]HIH08746.1 50S ribosomal protein L44e [Candidatus Diapherotrites archaeon]
MNLPKEVQDYCKKCNSHTSQKLKQFKPGKARAMSWGTRENIRKHKKGYGGKAEFTATVKKQNKKPTFVAECAACKTKHYFVIPKRMKKIELVA